MEMEFKPNDIITLPDEKIEQKKRKCYRNYLPEDWQDILTPIDFNDIDYMNEY